MQMQPLCCFDTAESKVEKDAGDLLHKIHEITKRKPENAEDAIAMLRELRSTAYENINQIPHEYLIIRCARWLIDKGHVEKNVQWKWNPRQTGSAKEPDLLATKDQKRLISAEMTTSETPQGTIDKRMARTLEKLSKMSGKQFYFVTTEEMKKRAETKVKKGKWDIKIVLINPVNPAIKHIAYYAA